MSLSGVFAGGVVVGLLMLVLMLVLRQSRHTPPTSTRTARHVRQIPICGLLYFMLCLRSWLSPQHIRDLALLLVRPIARFGRLGLFLELALVFAFGPITHGRDLLWHAILADNLPRARSSGAAEFSCEP
jgi:hypothetical protein